MRVLLDECVDRRLAADIQGHDVKTVPEAGWAALKNGDLLSRASNVLLVQATQDAGKRLGVSLRPLPVKSPEDFEGAFSTIVTDGIHAVFVAAGALTDTHAGRLAELAARTRVPAIYGARGFVEAGGLISYSASFADNYRRAAAYADKILRGARPGDLPVEQASTFELAVNLRTAKALGLSIPPSVLLRADVVIE